MRAIVLASTALVLAIPASSQTVEERLLKARTEVNATQNAADRALTAIKKPDIPKATLEINATKNAASRALYAIDQALKAVVPVPPPPPPPVPCPDGSTVPAGQTCPVVTPPPPPATQTCPDGTVILATSICPVTPPPPPPASVIDNKLAIEGDSISVSGSTMYPNLFIASRPSVKPCYLAVGGSNIITMTARIGGVTTCNPEAVTVLIGPNDLLNYSTTQGWLDALFAYTAKVKAAGRKVAVGTLLPRIAGSAGNQIPFNTRRQEVNAAIRAAVGVRIDAVVDYAADPRIGDDDDAKDTTLFPDGLHPSAKGHAIMAEIYTPVVDKLLGVTAPAPVPQPTPTPTPSTTGLTGETPIASNFDVQATLLPSSIPGSASPDTVGAFRFICGAGQLSNDDPILFPGQPGKSHLHQFYGHTGANAHSTYASLRASGESTCNFTGNGTSANRSAYWMPAMLDGKGNVVRPDYVSIYYKQRPASDPVVSDPTNAKYRGKAIQLPNGLKFIFGWDPTGVNVARTGSAWFNCQGSTATPGHYSTLTTALANCPAGNQVGAVIQAPECWDGKNLDSADHRSHVAYASYGTWGYLKCPTTHPYDIPTFTLGAWYTVAAGDNTALWELSSDMMAPGQPKGHTFHADFFMAWDPTVHDMWWQNCVNKLLNCSAGQLGNGKQLKGAAQPTYGWKNPQRLVPVPQ